jgi:hypothetical protein
MVLILALHNVKYKFVFGKVLYPFLQTLFWWTDFRWAWVLFNSVLMFDCLVDLSTHKQNHIIWSKKSASTRLYHTQTSRKTVTQPNPKDENLYILFTSRHKQIYTPTHQYPHTHLYTPTHPNHAHTLYQMLTRTFHAHCLLSSASDAKCYSYFHVCV